MTVLDDTRQRLVSVTQFAKQILDLSERSLAALEDGGLMSDVHGVPCHELVRQNAVLAAYGVSWANAHLDVIRNTMDKIGKGTL